MTGTFIAGLGAKRRNDNLSSVASSMFCYQDADGRMPIRVRILYNLDLRALD